MSLLFSYHFYERTRTKKGHIVWYYVDDHLDHRATVWDRGTVERLEAAFRNSFPRYASGDLSWLDIKGNRPRGQTEK